ncbi:MAG: Stringent starvation protein B [Catillopecten margaritatus gill symbiont]|uniref:Stringent starvation protein B n=1 Tax=Catillopecten margaritatus gill symbiont TaxID=3083288 RepID=A0AAU6PHN1_9GAMM
MTSVAPYLMRAYHQWMEDSGLTPHILVDCSKSEVTVPKAFIQQGKIVLNIASQATSHLVINNESISFKARFEGKSQDIFVPTNTVLTIYAAENGEGMFFENDNLPVAETEKKPTLKILD